MAPTPTVWGRVPGRNINFTGREELLNRLRSGIARQVTAVVPHALQGYGGVGKTQMAVEYAHRFKSDYEVVWWIPSDQPSLVRPTLAALAPHLGLPPVGAMGVEEAASAVLDCLRRGEPFSRWLLIFDNADQPEDLRDYLPQGDGHVLITSRNPRWESVARTVPVEVFSRSESIEFLGKRVPREIPRADADRLANELGDLPLALEQAGALQAETGMSVTEYLRLLEERASQLLAEGKPTEYPVSMTAAWKLSLDSLADKLPEAVELLRCCAFFGPEPIPRDVFTRAPEGIGEPLAGLLNDPIRLSRALGELGRYALARVESQSRTIQVHRLIQALLRDEITVPVRRRIRADVHRLLVDAAPPDVTRQYWQRYSELLGHIVPAEVGESQDPRVRDFAIKIVQYLYNSGDYSLGRRVAELFLDRWVADTPEGDPQILLLRYYFANMLRALGDFGAAYDIDKVALEQAERLAGPEYEIALRFRNTIGADLRARGDFREAREHDIASLEIYERVFGDNDRSTLQLVNNLALDYGLNSDYERARELHGRAYAGFTRIPDSDPSTSILNAWNGLARAARLCGDYAEACDSGEDVYAYGVNELTAEHPWTMRAGTDLAIAYRRLGENLDAALELSLDVHGRFVRLYGLNHPDTLAAAMCLSNVQRTLGHLEDAHELAADTVRRYPRAYGPEHPYNYGCMGNLAVLLRTRGDVAGARSLNERALEGLRNVLGHDQHYALTVAANLASDLAELGELDDACALGGGTLRRLRSTMGEEHPMTLACAANLSVDLNAAGRREEASKLHKETMDAYVRTLGLDHRDAIVAAEQRHLDFDFDPPPI
ncbi:FxSxx-COOH system tetratricopeptide repeat protein [Actinomadura sp. WMMB 499]|uniref:FxSxx-COOH system tetratricopeptide repeat protein n=1 Tax=Actinomadura sp. WMMB 499 TaxID=1219491 RepID=UPI0020C78D3C|nr:FxSxx-COOH system tetratricopeptide repeat protein [Actinomadura sp. WMMB 499]